MRPRIFTLFLLFLFVLYPAGMLDAQQKKVSDAARKKEKVERSYKKAYAKARKRTIAHRREIQTEDTRKMMDEAHKRSKTYNRENDPGFLERVFKRKRPPKNKKY